MNCEAIGIIFATLIILLILIWVVDIFEKAFANLVAKAESVKEKKEKEEYEKNVNS